MHDHIQLRTVDVIFCAREEECGYYVVFRVNAVEIRERAAQFYVERVLLVVNFRVAEPSDAESTAEPATVAVRGGIGFEHKLLAVSCLGDDNGAMFSHLARLALAWRKREASSITV